MSKFGGIPVVYGNPAPASTNVSGSWSKGEDQGSAWRDVGFAIAYYLQLIIVIAIAVMYGPAALEDSSTTTDDVATDTEDSFDGYVYVALITSVFAVIASSLFFSVMTRLASVLIKVSLILAVALTGVFAVVSLLSGSMVGAIFSLILFVVMVFYARGAWSRIPFATANMITAIAAIRANWGLVLISFATLIWSLVISMGTIVAILGVSKETETCDDKGYCESGSGGYIFLFLVSLFWSQQVMKNTIQVTVAGTVGTWWVAPQEATSCCSKGVRDSFVRATTYSFGSICFGSLIVAVLEALKSMANNARNNGEGGILLCFAECILGCLQSIIEYFNQWAFIYVGLYGYGYCESGKNVMNLFKARGWEAIIVDNLVDWALFFVAMMIGLLCGVVAELLYAASDDTWFENAPTFNGANFILGFIIGTFLSSILMSTISSGVNSVIVLFAEQPTEFDRNHSELSSQMRSAWLEIYPGCL